MDGVTKNGRIGLSGPLITGLLILCCISSEAQIQSVRSELSIINETRNQHHQSQRARAEKYAAEYGVPMKFSDGRGNTIYLVGVDDYGLPVYRTTLNSGAAITTGASALHPSGSLGISLEGEGMVVGIWDEGRVSNHPEFGTRIQSNIGTTIEAHTVHVTGTVLAAGLQAAAKGMAPKATALVNDFANDDSEMAGLAKPDQTGLLISNHSYGTVTGFYTDGSNWLWAGNNTISSQEDFKFGFYSSQSRVLDQIAFNAPYYTIVWAAGNDRSDSGDGSHPPDGNGGTGYDCIGPEGVAKNIITVGAVNKVLNYAGPSSVVMSTFSNWGPTDDGRIKPDLVGAGVSIYSTFVEVDGASVNNTYSFQQGTSMAAPNVTGSLTLLQELYQELHAGDYMRASTLKALAIHTAKEAGLSPGPDYSFGWGLLDVKAAAELLLAEDNQSVLVQENTLLNGQTYVYDFEPLPNSKVTATVVWTDPAGTPVANQLDPTTLMLVNDLDIRLVDGANNTVLPWVLNPFNPSAAATRGDNTRDNVEKIEFDLPEPRVYRVEVSHKGTLVGSKQDFALILTFTPNNDPKTAYYWIGNSGNWNDPTKWSLTSGGAPANVVPDINGRVIVDENSFSAEGQTITLPVDVACASLTWLAKTNATLNLNNRKLQVDGNVVVSSNALSMGSGTIELLGISSLSNQLNTNGNNLNSVDVIVNSAQGTVWTMNGAATLRSLTLQQGGIAAPNAELKVQRLDATGSSPKSLDIRRASITGLTQSSMNAASLTLTSDTITSVLLGLTPATLSWSGLNYHGRLETGTVAASLSGGPSIGSLVIKGPLNLSGNSSFGKLETSPGASLTVQSGSVVSLTSLITLGTDAANRLSIGTSGAGAATFNFAGHFKKCFDYLDINNVSVSGDVTISAGANSTLTNAPNWYAGACEEALFADFSFRYNCRGAVTEFTNLSDGNITGYSWNFGDTGSSQNTSTDESPLHQYNSLGNYTVSLTITNGTTDVTYQLPLQVITNTLTSNQVILANQKLFSELTAPAYQWFKDGIWLNGQTNRSYEYSGFVGTYMVVIKDGLCSLPSAPFIVTSVEESVVAVDRVRVFPNPATTGFTLEVPETVLPASFNLINSLGQVVGSGVVEGTRTEFSTLDLRSGFYILDMKGKQSFKIRVIVQR